MKKMFAMLGSIVVAAAVAGAQPAAPVCGDASYVSIVRDVNGRVVEKSSGVRQEIVDNPAFRVAVTGCLFAQLQSEDVLDPDRLVTGYMPGFKKLTLREAMVNASGPRFALDVVEPCLEKIAGGKIDDILEERFLRPLGISGATTRRPAGIRDVYTFFCMLANNGVAENGVRVMSEGAVRLLRRGQAPLTVNRLMSYGTRPRENGRFIGLDSTPDLDAVANPDTGECAVWLSKTSPELKGEVWKASRPLRTAVYAGVGPMGLSSTELVRYVARSPELDLVLVDGNDVRNGALDGVDLLVMPGGISGLIVGDLGPEGVANVKSFVRRGGGYVGICAGCVVLLDDEFRAAYGTDMVPYSRYGAFSGDAMTSMVLTDEGASALGMEKTEFDVWYSAGPIMFRRHEEVPDAKIETWGLFGKNVSDEGWGARMSGCVSCIGGTYGKGRIAATACHPEFRHSSDALAKGLFRYAAGREVTFSEQKANPGATKVYYYSWPVSGKECARLLVELDADPDIEVTTGERDEMCKEALDLFDALVLPDGADWAALHDMYPPEVESAIAAYAAKGGKVYSWGAGVRHLPRGGIACRGTYDAYARLKTAKRQ